MKKLHQLQFNNQFSTLSDAYYTKVKPTPLAHSHMVSFSPSAVGLMGIDPKEFSGADAAEYFSGAKSFSSADPLAMLYAGHQFGHFVPQLGDGRAILLGGVVNPYGDTWEWQLKGAGLTAYSRGGDGRAVLRSTVREYLCSEAMHGLGIATTRALCMTASDEEVYREQIETGAMVLRMAPSHIRFGSFEVFYYRNQHEEIKQLADFVIQHHYPEHQESATPYLNLLESVVLRTAKLMAQWQLVGFAHGVMNTDNMSILGLTLDYGPFGFLDEYNPDYICNHSDHQGRYAFDKQPSIGLWNLTCLAQTFLPIINVDDGEAAAESAQAILAKYEPALIAEYARGMRNKLGLMEAKDGDQALSADLLALMHKNSADYTNVFRALSRLQIASPESDSRIRDQFLDRDAFDAWVCRYRERLQQENSHDAVRHKLMLANNPKFILRNYLAQQAIEKAEKRDYSEVDNLLHVLLSPFDEHPEFEHYAIDPPSWSKEISISCSS